MDLGSCESRCWPHNCNRHQTGWPRVSGSWRGVAMAIESPHESPLLEDEYDKVKAHDREIANGRVERVEWSNPTGSAPTYRAMFPKASAMNPPSRWRSAREK